MSDLSKMVAEWADAWSAHDLKRVTELFTDECVYEDVTLNVVNHGKSELDQFGQGFIAALPDVTFALESLVVGDGRAAAEWTMVGTQTGDMPGLPATGKRCSVRGASAF